MRAPLLLALFSGLFCGCSTEAEAPAPADAAPLACSSGAPLSSVSGLAVDEAGSPLEGAFAQLCAREPSGLSYCLAPQRAGAGGVFRLSPPEGRGCVASAAVRLAADDRRRSPLYCLAPAGPDARFASPLSPPRVRPAVSLPPEGDPAAAREVAFEGGLRLTLRPDDLTLEGGSGYADLAASPVAPGEAARCSLGLSPLLAGLYAFGPQGELARPASVRLPNAAKIPPGTTVTLYVLGGLSCLEAGGRAVAEGEMAPAGEGRVSDDGQEITAGPEAGLRCLTWLGWAER